MSIQVCKKICNECPFSVNSAKGWLADYTVDNFKDYINNEILFPCHKLIPEDMSIKKVDSLVRKGQLKLCRGYAESVIKSCKLPKDKDFQYILSEIRDSITMESMPIWEFIKHHIVE